MIKAWRCCVKPIVYRLGYAELFTKDYDQADVEIPVNPERCESYEAGKCMTLNAGKSCDAKPIGITLLAKHEEVQAALAAAEKVLTEIDKGTYAIPLDTGLDIKAALTKIRRSNG